VSKKHERNKEFFSNCIHARAMRRFRSLTIYVFFYSESSEHNKQKTNESNNHQNYNFKK